MAQGYDTVEDIAALKLLIEQFKSHLPNRVDPASLTWESKIPWRVVILREALLYRITELGESAIELYEKENRTISAFIVTRAIHETTALFYSLYLKLKKAIDDQSFKDFNDFHKKVHFGFKNEEGCPIAINILNAVDKLDKLIPGFRRNYDILSEFCHPNYSGVFGAYAVINKKTGWVDFSPEIKNASPLIGLPLLVSSLKIFRQYYDESDECIRRIIELCEDRSTQKT